MADRRDEVEVEKTESIPSTQSLKDDDEDQHQAPDLLEWPSLAEEAELVAYGGTSWDPAQQRGAEEVRVAGCSENAASPSPKDEQQPKFSLPKARPLRAAVFGFVEQTQRCSNEQKLRSKSSSSSPAGKNKISPKRLRTSCLQDRAQALDPDIRADLQKMKASGSLPVFRNSRSGCGAGPGPPAAASSRAAAPGEAAPAEVRKTESLPAAEEAGEKLNEGSAPGAQLAQMNLGPTPGVEGGNVAAPPARERSRSGSIVDRMKSYFFSGVGGTQILDVDPGQLHAKDMIKAKDEAGAAGPPGEVVAPAKSSKEEERTTTTTFLGRLGKAGTQLMGSILESQRGGNNDGGGIDVIDMEDDSEHERIVRMKEKDLDLERGLDVEAAEEPQEEDPNLLLGGGIRKNKSSEEPMLVLTTPAAGAASEELQPMPMETERKEPLVLDQSALPESLRLADHSAPNDDQDKLGSDLPQSQDLLNLSARLQNKAEAAERSLLHGDNSARASRKILPGAYTTLMAGGAASNGLQLRSSKKKAAGGLDHKVASLEAASTVEQNKLKATTQTMSDSESEGGAMKMLSAAKQRSLASPGAIDCLGQPIEDMFSHILADDYVPPDLSAVEPKSTTKRRKKNDGLGLGVGPAFASSQRSQPNKSPMSMRDPYLEDDQVLGAPRAPPSPRTQSAFELALAIREGRVRPRVPSGDIASNLSNVSMSAEIIPRGAAATLVADVVVETGEEQKAQAEVEGACGSQVLTRGADDNDDHEDVENKGTGVEGHDEAEQLVDRGPGMKVNSRQKQQQEREIAVEEVVGASSSNVDRENGKEAAEGDINLSFPVTRPLHGLRLHTIIEEDSAALASSPSRSRRASASNRASCSRKKQELREEEECDAVIVLDDSSSSDERDGGEIENEQDNGGRVNIKKLKILSKKERNETLNQQQQSVVVKQEQIDGAPSGGNIKSATSSSSRTTTRSRRVAFELEESGCKGVSTPGGAAVAVVDSIKKEIPSEGNLPQEEVIDGAVDDIEQGAGPGSAFSCSSKRRKLEQQRTPRKNVEADPSASVNYLVGMKTPFSCGGSVAAYDLPMSDCGGEQEEDEFPQDVSALHKLDLSAIPQIPEQATPAQDASVAGLLKQYLPSQGGGNSFGGVGDQHHMLNKEPHRLSLRLTQDELAKLDSDVARSVSQMQKEQRCAGQGVCLLSSAGEPSASGARRNNHEATSAKGNACSSSPSRNVNVSKMQNAPPATSKHTSVKKETLLPPEGEAEGEAGEVDGEDAGNAKRKKKRANYNYRKLKLPDDDVLSSPSAGAGDQQELAGRRLLEVDGKDEERHASALVHYEEQAHQCGQLQVVAAAVPPAARNQNPRVLGNLFSSNKRKPCVIATGFRFTEEEREGLTQLGANVVDSWHIDVRFCVLSEDVGFISMKMFCSAAWPESKIVSKHWMQNSLSGGQLQAASGATPPAGFLQTVEREYGGAFRNTEPDEPCLFDPRSGLNAENRFNCVYLYPSVSRGDHKDGILITQLIKALGTTLLKSYPRKQNPRCLFIGKPRDWEHATQKGHKLYRANLLYEAALRRVLNLDRWKIVKVKQEQMEAENGIANEAVADR
eukprot:g12854.t1